MGDVDVNVSTIKFTIHNNDGTLLYTADNLTAYTFAGSKDISIGRWVSCYIVMFYNFLNRDYKYYIDYDDKSCVSAIT